MENTVQDIIFKIFH